VVAVAASQAGVGAHGSAHDGLARSLRTHPANSTPGTRRLGRTLAGTCVSNGDDTGNGRFPDMNRTERLTALLLGLGLLLAGSACGGDGATGSSTTGALPVTTVGVHAPATTTTAPATTVPPAPTTSAPPTTTSSTPPTTTATTTTRVSDPAADAVVGNKTVAAAAAIPTGWDTAILTNQFGEEPALLSACIGPDDFDLDTLDAVSLAVAEVETTGPARDELPAPPEANLEARVFASADVAADAFAVLEKTLGTTAGRECLADALAQRLEADLPPDTTFDFTLGDLVVPGTDVGARVVVELGLGGISLPFTVELLASRTRNCTVFASFSGFGDGFDPAVRDAMMAAAAAP